jgi:hypothetical protein
MTRRFLTYLFVGLLALAGPLAYATDRVAAPTTERDLDAAITKTLGQEDASRAAITSLLQREDVRSMAEGYGLDVGRAASAVKTLQGDELQRLSALASDANVQLAGGDQVLRISLVAALLIVIIVILLTR